MDAVIKFIPQIIKEAPTRPKCEACGRRPNSRRTCAMCGRQVGPCCCPHGMGCWACSGMPDFSHITTAMAITADGQACYTSPGGRLDARMALRLLALAGAMARGEAADTCGAVAKRGMGVMTKYEATKRWKPEMMPMMMLAIIFLLLIVAVQCFLLGRSSARSFKVEKDPIEIERDYIELVMKKKDNFIVVEKKKDGFNEASKEMKDDFIEASKELKDNFIEVKKKQDPAEMQELMLSRVQLRSKASQSQTTYRRDLAQPRFQPLAEYLQC